MSHHHGGPPGGHHEFEHHAPPHFGHDAHETELRGEVVKVFSEANTGFNLAARGDEIVVVEANDSDPYQQWIKDESWSDKAKDSAGLPAFALINRGSRKALCHPPKVEEKVGQAVYYENSLGEEVLWSMSHADNKGWHAIRPISNIKLNLDIDHGGKKYGPIKNGQAVIVFTWKDEKNQHWKMTPISISTSSHEHHHRD